MAKKLQHWIDTAKSEFDMTVKDATRLRRISTQLMSYDLLACERNLTADEVAIEYELMGEVKTICDRYGIQQADDNSIGYEFPSRSNSGLRFIFRSGNSIKL